MRFALTMLVSASLLTAACAAPPSPSSAAATAPVPLGAQPSTPATFSNRVWQTTPAPGEPPQYYVFLAEGTLVIASSTGTPMVGRWARAGAGLTMVEEGREYPTDILSLTGDEFRIRSHNPGEPREIRLVPADRHPPGPAR